MILLSLFVALIIDRFAPKLEVWRRYDWLEAYQRFLQSALSIFQTSDSPRWLIILFSPILFGVFIIQWFTHSWFGLSDLLFSSAALWVSLGPRALDRELDEFIKADQAGQSINRYELTRDLLEQEPPSGESSKYAAVSQALLWQANNRFFAPVFWFILLGPFGAIFYRLTAELVRASNLQYGWGRANSKTSKRLLDILDWLPVRLTAILYALSGSTEDAIHRWQQMRQIQDEETLAPRLWLTRIGQGALKLEHSTDVADIEVSQALIWRAAIIFTGLIAIFAILFWIS